jgi:hypothetical protein
LLPSAGTIGGVYPSRDSVVLEWDFGGPPGYEGIPSGSSNHLFVFALRGPVGPNDFGGCPGGRVIGRTNVSGQRAVVMTCVPGGDSMNSGHVLVRWRIHGVTYEVSLHHPSAVNRRVAEAVAKSTVA